MNDALTPTPTSKIKRKPHRASYDRQTIYDILDAGFLCHISFNVDGRPCIVPTTYWRHENRVYWHASSAGRIDRLAETAGEVCFCATHIDGLVLGRAAFTHSANYRSVMIYGTPKVALEEDAKAVGLHAFIEGLFPGRMAAVRPPSLVELKATTLMSLDIEEAAAKVRTGFSIEVNESDMERNVWAGVIPLEMRALPPIRDPKLSTDIADPDYTLQFRGMTVT